MKEPNLKNCVNNSEAQALISCKLMMNNHDK